MATKLFGTNQIQRIDENYRKNNNYNRQNTRNFLN